MSLKALSDYIVNAKYAHYLPQQRRRETWEEGVDRVFAMYERKYARAIAANPELEKDISFARDMVKKKRVLGSQRAMQFGGAGVEKHNTKIYNCAFSYADRPAFFQEYFYALLAGSGVGFSVQSRHVSKLPPIAKPRAEKRVFTPDDSIEGWADCLGVLLSSYFVKGSFPEYAGFTVEFDFSKIRPAGTLIAGQFKAPGSARLMESLQKIRALLDRSIEDRTNPTAMNRLRPIEVYDICMHASDAVLSGGVRRSASICLFDKEDCEMMTAKTGDWFQQNPQRARSNNSVVLVRDQCTQEDFDRIMESTKQFGEPGFVFVDDPDVGVNPCLVGSTIIKTPDGEIRLDALVEKIKNEGPQIVWSFNPETGRKELDLATAGDLTRKNANCIEIELENGNTLKLTPDHKVFTQNRGWVETAKLTQEDDLVSW